MLIGRLSAIESVSPGTVSESVVLKFDAAVQKLTRKFIFDAFLRAKTLSPPCFAVSKPKHHVYLHKYGSYSR